MAPANSVQNRMVDTKLAETSSRQSSTLGSLPTQTSISSLLPGLAIGGNAMKNGSVGKLEEFKTNAAEKQELSELSEGSESGITSWHLIK